jgi:hypothetical protein
MVALLILQESVSAPGSPRHTGLCDAGSHENAAMVPAWKNRGDITVI